MVVIQILTKVILWFAPGLNFDAKRLFFCMLCVFFLRIQCLGYFIERESTEDDWATMKEHARGKSLTIPSHVAKTQPQAP